MKFLEIISGAIGKVWSFITTLILITFLSALVFFGLTVFMPEQVLNAIEIVTNLISKVL